MKPVAEVAAELELDVRKIKRPAVALEMVVRSWNLPNFSMEVAGARWDLRIQDARLDRLGGYLPFKGTSSNSGATLKTDEHREWTVVMPFDRSKAAGLVSPLVLKCTLVDSLRQFPTKPELQPTIEITGLTLITKEE